jgi:hypothetical protein
MRRAGLASAVRAAAAGNREIRRSRRAVSMAGMLPPPRINGMLHRVTFAAIWDSLQESGSRAAGISFPVDLKEDLRNGRRQFDFLLRVWPR